ncbi:MAG: tail fiber domain-containing protein [Bryobacteraceae bacterium]
MFTAMFCRQVSARVTSKSALLVGLLTGMAAVLPVRGQTVSNFLNLTPCRIIDTRDPGFGGGLGPPFMPAKSVRMFPVLSSNCGIPNTASAYSLNVTVVPRGPMPYLSMWPWGQPQPVVSTLNAYNGSVVANAAIVPAGANGAVAIYVDGDTDVIVDVNGYFVQQQQPQQITNTIIQQVPAAVAQSTTGLQSTALGTGASSVGAQNTAVGYNSLIYNNSGTSNTATGSNALAANVSGTNNVGIGASSLSNNASGSSNTAVGTQSLFSNGIANNNTAVGFQALWNHTTNCCNTAVGFQAMANDTAGQFNVALGNRALSSNTTGNGNVALGNDAGNQINGSSNIAIGHSGVSGESNAIRIGTAGTHLNTYVAGISGVSLSGASQVLIDASGHLGTFSSSHRYKEDIREIGDASSHLMDLQPVQFRYRQPASDGSKPLQYGLIAEDVATVYPELVVRDEHGQIESVQYHQLPALLLNELQKEHRTVAEQAEQIRTLTKRLEVLEAARYKK